MQKLLKVGAEWAERSSPTHSNAKLRRMAAGMLALLLGACASFSPDGGMEDVGKLARERVGTPARSLGIGATDTAVRDAVKALLGQPLSADAAVELALLNNPGLKVQLAELGLAETDLVRAGTLRNPVFAYSNKRNSDVTQIDRTIMVNVAALVFMPLALDLEQRRFEQAKVTAALNVVSTAAATRQAYFRAVAAQEALSYLHKVQESAEASSVLARRMAEVGNFSKLASMREQAFHADATAQLARAQQVAVAEREQLTRWLGLTGADTAYALPSRLPDLPATPLAPADAEQAALDRRLDVQLAKRDAESTAQTLGLTRATRFVNVLEVGYTNESETGDRRKNGYEIELELPLFDWGTSRVARAELLYRQALARTAQVAVNAQSEVREAYGDYRTAYELAKHYRDEIVPLRRRIADENLLRYNGMLIGVFELLADAREQVGSVSLAIEATRDYWLAESVLQMALAGGSPGRATGASGVRTARTAATAGGH